MLLSTSYVSVTVGLTPLPAAQAIPKKSTETDVLIEAPNRSEVEVHLHALQRSFLNNINSSAYTQALRNYEE
jgi:hypothetical protein